MPGNYSGSQAAELVVWRPSTGVWHIRNVADIQWGQLTDIPIA